MPGLCAQDLGTRVLVFLTLPNTPTPVSWGLCFLLLMVSWLEAEGTGRKVLGVS